MEPTSTILSLQARYTLSLTTLHMKLPHERPGCAWLFASLGSRAMMVYYCTGGVLQYASGHLTPIELLHVHRVRGGERVAKASPSLASHHAHGRGGDALAFVCMTGCPHTCRAHPCHTRKGRSVLPSPMSVVAGKTRRSFRYTLSLPHAVDMQQFNRCQMARSVL